MHYDIEWIFKSLAKTPTFDRDVRWIVFANQEDKSEAVVRMLRKAGKEVVVVRKGLKYKKVKDAEFEIHPTSKDDYIQLFKKLNKNVPTEILYFWGIEDLEKYDLENIKNTIQKNCQSLINLIQSILSEMKTHPPRGWFFTEGIMLSGSINGLTLLPITALWKSIAVECPQLKLKRISLDHGFSSEKFANAVLSELSYDKEDEDYIAWHNEMRFVPRLVQIPENKNDLSFNENASYLICADVNCTGLKLLEWLVARGAKSVFFISNNEISEDTKTVIKKLTSSIDFTFFCPEKVDKKTFAKIFDTIKGASLPLKGIISAHTAHQHKILKDMQPQDFENLEPWNIDANWYLHHFSLECDIKDFIFFPSVGPFLSPIGGATRVVSSSFQDALCHWRKRMGLAAKSIDWCGLLPDGEKREDYQAMLPAGISLISWDRCVEMLDSALLSSSTQVVVGEIDWETLLTSVPKKNMLFENLYFRTGMTEHNILELYQHSFYTRHKEILSQYLGDLCSQILHKSQGTKIHLDKTLEKIGFNDETLARFKQDIETDFEELAFGFIEEINPKTTLSQILTNLKKSLNDHFEKKNEMEPIAIIGMDCIFPGAQNAKEFWRNLESEKNAISLIPGDRWSWKDYFGDPHKDPQKTNIKYGSFIKDVDKFDPMFFKISPKEAQYIDPQHRLFLQCVWHAMENAGYSSDSFAGKKIGVYAGVSKNDYAELMREKGTDIEPFISTGTVHSLLTNRVSYILDLKGGSESFDTACSSALVAIHHAVDSLLSGECSLAFAGGVNCLLSPTMFISHSRSGMLSVDGQCKTFDASANGYVRGEGVGVILLKKLSNALADGDNIHAVIRSTATNHGGQTPFLTSPSMDAQADVIIRAIKRAKIDPKTISYIETHGTGTPLGDPLEIDALKGAFSYFYEEPAFSENPWCALGAVKTNIGHLESASGMPSIIKMILCMQHRFIPKNLNFHEINPYIDLENSPFYLSTNSSPWKAPQDTPMRGGVSSFGMGGANAHIILEEPPKKTLRKLVQKKERGGEIYLAILSTKHGQMPKSVLNLIHYLDENPCDYDTFERLIYTLQCGRDAFEDRLAIICKDSLDLRDKLMNFAEGNTPEDSYYAEKTKPLGLEDYHEGFRTKKTLDILADRWTMGFEVKWHQYYQLAHPTKLPLPVYPFVKLSCWVKGGDQQKKREASVDKKIQEIEIIQEIPKSVFYLRDHVVQNVSLLPGVMYLELARALAASYMDLKIPIEFQNVEWLFPAACLADTLECSIRLTGQEKIHYQISVSDKVCGRGKITSMQQAAPKLKKDALPSELKSVPRDEIYQILAENHLQYGKTFQVVETFGYDKITGIGRLNVADQEAVDFSSFLLHPAILDGMMQSVVLHYLLTAGKKEPQYLPYQVESIKIYEPVLASCNVVVKKRDSIDAEKRYDMQLLSDSDELLLEVKGFIKKPVGTHVQEDKKLEKPKIKPYERAVFYENIWKESEGEGHETYDTILLFSDGSDLAKKIIEKREQGSVMIVRKGIAYSHEQDTSFEINPESEEDYEKMFFELKLKKIKVEAVVYLWDRRSNPAKLVEHLLNLLYLAKGLIKSKNFDICKLLFVYESLENLMDARYAMTGGFARTLFYENPAIELRSVYLPTVDQEEESDILLRELRFNNAMPLMEVRYVEGIREVRTTEPSDALNQIEVQESIKESGVYLITGGAGGLGKSISGFFAKHYKAKLILIGRRAADDKIKKQLDEIAASGGEAIYLAVDITDLSELKKVLEEVPSEYRTIDGVIHAAGVIDDAFILQKSKQSFEKVVKTKVQGAFNLDLVTREKPLLFFVLFSSIASILPNQGQVDYASANSFLDAFAALRNQLLEKGQRKGVSLAINWPLWKEGGMQVTEEETAHLEKVFGMKPLETDLGVKLFHYLLCYVSQHPSQVNNIIIIDGDREKISNQFHLKRELLRKEKPKGTLQEIILHAFADQLNVEGDIIDQKEKISRLGLDSMAMVALSKTLSEYLGVNIKPTLFFEYDTIERLITKISTLKEVSPPERPQATLEVDLSGVVHQLKELLAPAIGIGIEDLDEESEFELLGINSIMILKLNNVLEERFGSISKTLFFEYSNLLELAEYFLKTFPTQFKGEQIVSEEVEEKLEEQMQLSSEEYPLLIDSALSNPEKLDFRRVYSIEDNFVGDFSYSGHTAIPGACFLEMGRQAATIVYPERPILSVYDNYWPEALMITEASIEVQAKLSLQGSEILYEIITQNNQGKHTVHATGKLGFEYKHPTANVPAIKEAIDQAEELLDPDTFYQTIFDHSDLRLKSLFKPIKSFHYSDGFAVSEVLLDPEFNGTMDEFGIHPVVLTAVEQSILVHTVLAHKKYFPHGMRCMPISIEAVDLYKPFPKECYFHLTPLLTPSATSKIQKYNITIVDKNLDPVALVSGNTMRIQALEETVAAVIKEEATNDFAIVGMSGKFPEASNIHEFWENLVNGRDCISENPLHRPYYHPTIITENHELLTCRFGGVVKDVDTFDPTFFGISPSEAVYIDPQERLFLEVAYEAIEDAGYTKDAIGSKHMDTGVFVGALWQDYQLIAAEESAKGSPTGPSSLLYSIANRVSYTFDLTGPSIAIDTACSSSLTALFLACQSIREGVCNAAIVGGVNLNLHPQKYAFLNRYHFLSEDGKCRSFGEGGTGYVPGEGVIAIMIKPLTKAIEDHDSIYGVIKSTFINHGGKTNGYTVPNPNVQARLIKQSLRKAGINPREISYVEAHGTGTELGDPIEITGLTKAYQDFTDDQQYCAIGSVKSNIGHLEAAAGLASIVKVLLQMKHGQLVPSLHSETINPNIEFEKTPFYLQHELASWKKDKHLSAVSSFGAGGSYAHVILQSYQAEPTPKAEASEYVIVLSSKTTTQLAEKKRLLKDFLEENELNLADISYTLAVGREEMECRFATVVKSVEELIQKLGVESQASDIYFNEQAIDSSSKIEDYSDLNQVAKSWVAGCRIDWEKLFPKKPTRIHLPTYPFQRKSYWIEQAKEKKHSLWTAPIKGHPILGERLNSPSIDKMIYQTQLSPTWPEYLVDHKIYDHLVIAGMTYVSSALTVMKDLNFKHGIIEDLEFLQALVIPDDSSVLVQTLINDESDNRKSFRVVCRPIDAEVNDPWTTIVTGYLKEGEEVAQQSKLQLDDIQKRLPKNLNKEEFYQGCHQLGLHLDEHHQWIEEVYVGDQELLARYRLPMEEIEREHYVLFPGFLDACFQIVLAKLVSQKKQDVAVVPISLDSFWYNPSGGYPVWVYAKSNVSPEGIEQTNLILFDSDFNQVGQLSGARTREAPNEALEKLVIKNEGVRQWLYQTEWIAHKTEADRIKDERRAIFIQTNDLDQRIKNGLSETVNIQDMTVQEFSKHKDFSEITDVVLDLGKGDTAESVEPGLLDLLLVIKTLVSQSDPKLIRLYIYTTTDPLQLEPVRSMLMTLELEAPQIAYLHLASETPGHFVEEFGNKITDHTVIYEGNNRLVPRLTKVKPTEKKDTPPISKNGTYLITGGFGGLGLELAKWLAAEGAGRLILVGRNLPNKDAEEELASLNTGKTRTDAIALDVCDSSALESFFEKIEHINGIFHLAGTLDDAPIVEQDEVKFKKVIAPKMRGCWNIFQALQHSLLKPEIFVLFSSISSTIGMAGQINYSAANGFLNGFAKYSQDTGIPCQSIAWGPWTNVGMAKKLVDRHRGMGIIPLTPKEGLDALKAVLLLGTPEITIAHIDWPKYLKRLPQTPSLLSRFEKKKKLEIDLTMQLDRLEAPQKIEGLRNFIRETVRSILGLESNEPLDDRKGFFEMGLDSIMAITLINQLQGAVGKDTHIAKTAAFDFPDINAMTGHIASLLKIEKKEAESIREETSVDLRVEEPIAIIGISCRLPGGANDPDLFWELLEKGYDGIMRVPEDRFDADAFYDPDRSAPGKMISPLSGFLDIDVKNFDAAFFRITPKEAETLDPQHRLLLELTWEALENAGIPPEQLLGTPTGVYMGLSTHDYSDMIMSSGDLADIDTYYLSGNSFSTVCGRISYFLGTNGPCQTIDTACSTSLVALHNACESLKDGESTLALVGAANLILFPAYNVYFTKAGMLSPDGHCKTFDSSADGYVRGEGGGVLVLKRLSVAKRDGDHIFAVVKATGVNQDGASSGLTVPNGEAQAALMRRVAKKAGIKTEVVDYIETHGTGTSLGDPIEVGAIGRIYGQNRTTDHPIVLGAIKTNIGHLEAAAGLASIVKVILSLQHKKIPQNLHFNTLNPKIELNFPAIIPTKLVDWEKRDHPRIACVSGFAFQGTNAHAILEEAPSTESATIGNDRPCHILALSAKSQEALEDLIAIYQKYLTTTDESLSDIAYTANVGREHFKYRACIIAKDVGELEDKLKKMDYLRGEGEDHKSIRIKIVESGGFIVSQEYQISVGPETDWTELFKILAKLYVEGATIDWQALDKPYPRRKVQLPNYPFQRIRYWAEVATVLRRKLEDGIHPLLGVKKSRPDGEVEYFGQIDLKVCPYLKDHRVFQSIVFPGAGYLEMMAAGSWFIAESKTYKIENISIEKVLSLSKSQARQTYVLFAPTDDAAYTIAIYSQDENKIWHNHANATLSLDPPDLPKDLDINELKDRCHQVIEVSDLYESISRLGIQYGEMFQTIKSLSKSESEVFAELAVSVPSTEYIIHPALLDGCLQLLFGIVEDQKTAGAYLPIGCDSFSVYHPAKEQMFAHLVMREDGEELKIADIILFDETGQVIAKIDRIHCRRTNEASLKKMLEHAISVKDWFYEWIWEEKDVEESTIQEESGQWALIGEPAFVGNSINCQKISFDSKESFPVMLAKIENLAGVIFTYNDEPLQEDFADIKSFIQLVQAVIEMEQQPPIYLVSTASLFQSPLYSIQKTVSEEHPELKIKSIRGDPEEVAGELFVEDGEEFVVYSQGNRMVGRLSRESKAQAKRQELARPEDDLFRLKSREKGLLENLELVPLELFEPLKPNEVEVNVHAVGLNFRDVLDALGLYPGEPGPMGGDGSGIVTAIGSDVKTISVGDVVFGVMPGSLARKCVVHQDTITKIGNTLSITESAALPTVFLTAHYALNHLAKLQPKEKVLIHAGAGGVGQAAIQLAKNAGAEIFATAGNEKKRQFLKEQGVHHAFDSRSLNFGNEIEKLTDGKGVDVVLNCLSGEGFIETTTGQCGKGARFLEIGKRDIWTQEQMKKARPDIEYHIIALDNITANEPAKIKELLIELAPLFETGELKPLPVTEFPIEHSIVAFNYMREAMQVGKIVITLPPKEQLKPQFKEDASYLITGGLGGLGLTLAKWLAEKKAGTLVLTGRSEANEEAKEIIEKIEAKGTKVVVQRANIGKKKDVEKLLESIPSLKGIFHLAGVLDDAPFQSQDWSHFEKVFATKVYGSLYLHQVTQEKRIDLDYFIFFSSVAATLGSPGQANYAAANAFMDRLAAYRRSHGLTAQSLAWGSWSEVGMAKEHILRHSRSGMLPIDPLKGIRALEEAMIINSPNMTIAPLNWPKYLKSIVQIPTWLSDFSKGIKVEGIIEKLEEMEQAEQLDYLKTYIVKTVKDTLGLTAAQPLDENKGFFDMGLDSLMAVELKNRLQRAVGQTVRLSSTLVFDQPSVDKLTRHLCALLNIELPKEKIDKLADQQTKELLIKEEIEQLSDDEIRKRLEGKL